MDTASTAQDVLAACGGIANIASNAVCMTRLRLELRNPRNVDVAAIEDLHGVLGVRRRGPRGFEVVFGPAIVDAISREFSQLTGIPLERKTAKAITQLTADGPRRLDHLHSTQRYGGKPDRGLADRGQLCQEDLDELRQLLEGAPTPQGLAPEAPEPAPQVRALVLNGPNLNLLGIREPDVYGTGTYEALVALCKEAGHDLGFSKVECFQTNHEGTLVDRIQEALGRYDGIVLNPAAYTHTSVAILDAVKAVGLPTVEVHISDVRTREDFRQVSYVRSACIATVMGEGFEGYAHALQILWDHLVLEGAEGSEAAEDGDVA